ncbi:phosphonate C-P lyase system protein PhnG [Falsigemmobacter intermedius]|uniref:phosphonate C-P lyase system protein PhnG n=1 Tax=Falsigemmobacter intermedius TaxID=1553448 RepID=UPI003F0AEE54
MPPTARQSWLSLLAKSPPDRLEALFPELPPHRILRAPEIGSVMVQGRTGGTGAPFSLTEMVVTRASLALDCGTVGHALVQGRSRDQALRVAALDALLQTDAAPGLEARVLAPLRAEAEARRTARAAKAAATKVEFFTLMRGED